MSPILLAGPSRLCLIPFLVVASLLAVPAASGQTVATDTTAAGESVVPNTDPVDVRVLRAVYGIDAPPFVVSVRTVNDTAYPVFLGSAPALAAGAALTGSDLDPALKLAASGVVTLGVTRALKNLFKRPRPYVALDGIVARDRGHQGESVFDPHSFPSGHTSTAFAIATSVSLSYPEWYVVVPAATWATTMGLARMWHGVHYPTDVAAGAAIGTVSALAVHVLLPDVLGGDEDMAVIPVRIVIPL